MTENGYTPRQNRAGDGRFAGNWPASIEQRIALFTPPQAGIRLDGYIVAGGDGGGYAFGDTDFYLNIGIVDELVVAKGVATHELYHAVQGAFAKERDTASEAPVNMRSRAQQACDTTARFFAKVYEEGSAVYVEDISLLSGAHSTIGLRKQNDMMDGLRHIHSSVSLLEMSVVALRADHAVPYDDVYDVGFYARESSTTSATSWPKRLLRATARKALQRFSESRPTSSYCITPSCPSTARMRTILDSDQTRWPR